ncbi:MAG: hypothetical protein Ta2F_06060 [Termitinemataceae bacterium]|nr:MAG: hypothetical protein Ta2F_06060 [Termitinemataceae bacterium]
MLGAIIVDPGHGGKDPGASTKKNINGKNVSIIEKDIVLDVSKELFRKLKRTFPDKQLIMTRAGDTYPSLKERSDKANAVPLKQNEAIIFVSVHANSSTNKDANGFEVWYLDPNVRRDVLDKKIINEPNEVIPIINDMLQEQFTTESILLSQMIAGEFQNTFGNSLPLRGILSKDWYVVKNSRMPAVLVELGFISNEKDAFLMLNQSQKFADAIFKGINDFVTRFESSEGFTAR